MKYTESMSFKERLYNIWYHYKWPIMFTVFVIVLAVVGIVHAVNKKEFDYQIICVTQNYHDINQQTELEKYFSEFGEDINNDGVTNVLVKSLSYNEMNTNPNSYAASLVLVNEDINNSESMIFIFDKKGFETYNKDFPGVFSKKSNEEIKPEEIAFATKGTYIGESLTEFGYDEDLFIMLRNQTDKADASYTKKYNESKKLLENVSGVNDLFSKG